MFKRNKIIGHILKLLLIASVLSTITIETKKEQRNKGKLKRSNGKKNRKIPEPPKRLPPPIPNSPEFKKLREQIKNSNAFKIALAYIPKDNKTYR